MRHSKFTNTLAAFLVAGMLFGSAPLIYAEQAVLPSTYDLREEGLVTPAKSQLPWSSCWAFGALSSIESNMIKKGLADSSIDLSERYLIWYATDPVDKETAAKQPSALLHPDKHSQEGEGEYMVEEGDPSQRFALGQYDWVVTSALSSGLSLQSENAYPYRNRAGDVDKGRDANGKPYSLATEDGDWTLEGSRENDGVYRLVESSLIPGTSNFSTNDETNEVTFNGYREDTIDEVKHALMDKGAVTLNYAADASEPNQKEDFLTFNYTHWAQYRSEPHAADHAVSIIGWDDSFPKENFANDSGELPQKDGAWKVKNSWGRKNADSYNTSSWGVDGEGWFYLSYYDKGIESFQTYSLEKIEGTPADIMQYDFIGMNNFGFVPIIYDGVSGISELVGTVPRVGNVFEAPYNLEINEVSIASHINDSETEISIYALKDKASDPEDGILVYSGIAKSKYAGYQLHKLTEPVRFAKGATFSIVESVKGTYEDKPVYELPIEIGYTEEYLKSQEQDAQSDEEEEEKLPDAVYKTVVNPGESYTYLDKWVDNTRLSDEEDFKEEGITYGNNLIKAFVKPTDEEIPNYLESAKHKKRVGFALVFIPFFIGFTVYNKRKSNRKKEDQTSQK